jgi:GNAT superfamily N-acetyltransferase
MFVLRPEYRDAGVGRRLLEALLARARDAGYERIELDTFSELRAAARLYGDAGFRCVPRGAAPAVGARARVRALRARALCGLYAAVR